MGRPLKKIDTDIVRGLAQLDCTLGEIAHVVGCDPQTISNRFSEVIKKGRMEGDVSIRRGLFNKAKGGNVACLIFLSKVRLGYSERVKVEGVASEVPHELSGAFGKLSRAAVDRFIVRIEKLEEPKANTWRAKKRKGKKKSR